MRIVIDFDLCQGHGNCEGDAPEIFRLDDDGKLHLLQETPAADQREKVEMAVKYCPTGALSVVEDG